MEQEKKENNQGQQEAHEKQGSSPLPPSGLAEDVLGAAPPEEKEPKKKKNPDGGNGGVGDEDLMKFVTFFLEQEEYALPIDQVQEINRVGEITRVPNSPEHVRGVINLRGKIVPVIELKQRFRLGETKVDKESRIVVVEQGPKVLGLMVDRVAQVLNVSSEQIESAPEEVVQIHENYIRGIGKIDGRMIILLELEKVIAQNHQ